MNLININNFIVYLLLNHHCVLRKYFSSQLAPDKAQVYPVCTLHTLHTFFKNCIIYIFHHLFTFFFSHFDLMFLNYQSNSLQTYWVFFLSQQQPSFKKIISINKRTNHETFLLILTYIVSKVTFIGNQTANIIRSNYYQENTYTAPWLPQVWIFLLIKRSTGCINY